jgi:hypothetical protein
MLTPSMMYQCETWPMTDKGLSVTNTWERTNSMKTTYGPVIKLYKTSDLVADIKRRKLECWGMWE